MTYMTDKTRLKNAFADLRKRGWFARMNYLCCQTCGFYSAAQAIKARTGDTSDDDVTTPILFYHAQDNERAFAGGTRNIQGTLYLSHSGDACVAVGVLVSHGLDVQWDGDNGTRIAVRHRVNNNGETQ